MKDKPNKTTVKDGLPTAERILNDHLWMGTEPTEAQSAILAAMQSYSDQQNAELDKMGEQLSAENSDLSSQIEGLKHDKRWLKERVKELEAWKNLTRGLINEIENRQTTADLMHIYAEESGVKEKDIAVYEAGFYDGMTFFRRRLNEELK